MTVLISPILHSMRLLSFYCSSAMGTVFGSAFQVAPPPAQSYYCSPFPHAEEFFSINFPLFEFLSCSLGTPAGPGEFNFL